MRFIFAFRFKIYPLKRGNLSFVIPIFVGNTHSYLNLIFLENDK